MYFDAPENTTTLQPSRELGVVFSANALLILGMGIFPSALMALCLQAFVL
jgi:NADH-quinone oxidoreductase subunit N